MPLKRLAGHLRRADPASNFLGALLEVPDAGD